MKLNYYDFQELLKNNNHLKACEPLESLWDALTSYMPISFELAKKAAGIIEQGEKDFFININNKINEQRIEGSAILVYQPTLEDMPKNICNFDGLKISAELFFTKSIYDFIHWARLCVELMCQLINAIIPIDNRLDTKNVDVAQIKNTLKSFAEYHDLLYLLKSATGRSIYKYICDFDNCIKHRKLVDCKTRSIQFSCGSELSPKFVISKCPDKGIAHGELDALKKIDEVSEFIQKNYV